MDLNTFYAEYMRKLDPTEYYYATDTFGSWQAWEAFVSKNRDTVESWRREMEAKIKSMCLAQIIDKTRDDTRDSLQAAKFLLDAPWISTESKRGRPSKVDIENEMKTIIENEKRVQEDFLRFTK